MLTNINTTDPWMQTVGWLSSPPDECAARPQPSRLPVLGERFNVAVNVIDRPSATTATLSWRDPTRCSYGDQVWHTARARVAGVCAMSGRAIRVGDAVFRPRASRPAPLNAGAMVLAVVLRAV
ncbi:DUF3331 domain-containing protein [Paraburkholderia sp.]|uniref:DUF3331 domain-containing protein n=1 Tax=Paraburkholderia sp. TaxID=1926495 RepID=UPI0023971919|nr:DUF3331 domain-containing protein [Paraburkholderia sp.]MDE1182145.1 DUF3331 domain-containing protein [Paraburkholderia sp.]